MVFNISDHWHTQDQHMASTKTTFLFTLNLSQNESTAKTKHPEPRTAGWCNLLVLWSAQIWTGKNQTTATQTHSFHQRAKAVRLHLKGKVILFRFSPLGRQSLGLCPDTSRNKHHNMKSRTYSNRVCPNVRCFISTDHQRHSCGRQILSCRTSGHARKPWWGGECTST